jgi:hypothetical protein
MVCLQCFSLASLLQPCILASALQLASGLYWCFSFALLLQTFITASALHCIMYCTATAVHAWTICDHKADQRAPGAQSNAQEHAAITRGTLLGSRSHT